MGAPRGDRAPHGDLEQIGPHWGMLTAPLPAKAGRLGPEAAGGGVRPRLPCARTGAETFSLGGLATVLTRHQALPHIAGATRGWPRLATLFLPVCLDGRTPLGGDQRGHRDGTPVCGGDLPGRDRAPGLEGASSLRPEPWAPRFLTGCAQRCRAHRGRIFSHAPHHTTVPPRLPRAGHLASARAPAADLPTRLAIASHPVKDLANETRFVGNARIARRPTAPHTSRPSGTQTVPRCARSRRPPGPPAACHAGGVRCCWPAPTPRSSLGPAGAGRLPDFGPGPGSGRAPPPRRAGTHPPPTLDRHTAGLSGAGNG
jgi:hypothetical protein